MENPDLPQEILVEIFSRIPTKSVGRCRTLSKCWNTHLSSPNFIKKHLFTRKQTLVLFTTCSDVFSGNLAPKMYISKKDELSDFKRPRSRFIASCNGLVLLNDLVINDCLLLFNPITRKQVSIPFHQFTTKSRNLGVYYAVYGFGYDSCVDDYKIVQILSYKGDFNSIGKYVDVYSVRNRVWKRIVGGYPYGEFLPNKLPFEGGGAYLNGNLHWLISRFGYRSCIAAFDLANEVFRKVSLPEGFVRQLDDDDVPYLVRERRSNGVSVVGGCLLIVDNHGDGTTDVWVLKEYGVEESWVKFCIQSEGGDYNWETIVAALCYVEEGELLCLTSASRSRNNLFACDLKEGTMRRVVLGDCDAWFVSGMTFVDSLVSPE